MSNEKLISKSKIYELFDANLPLIIEQKGWYVDKLLHLALEIQKMMNFVKKIVIAHQPLTQNSISY
jgi:hypothetical protein